MVVIDVNDIKEKLDLVGVGYDEFSKIIGVDLPSMSRGFKVSHIVVNKMLASKIFSSLNDLYIKRHLWFANIEENENGTEEENKINPSMDYIEKLLEENKRLKEENEKLKSQNKELIENVLELNEVNLNNSLLRHSLVAMKESNSYLENKCCEYEATLDKISSLINRD